MGLYLIICASIPGKYSIGNKTPSINIILLYNQNIGFESSIINEISPINVTSNELINTANIPENKTIIIAGIDNIGNSLVSNI